MEGNTVCMDQGNERGGVGEVRQIIKRFLEPRLKRGSTLLLGLSGGADSTALLHLLLDMQQSLSFSLHLAHVDHGWRSESQKEAAALREQAKQLGLPFHLKRLEKMEGKDLENRAREGRYAFFSELQKKEGFQALLLAHHRNDQAETVFKRAAEGSGIAGLGGIYPEKRRGNLLIWRPLLSLSKHTLLTYLSQKRVSFFTDRTNEDSLYLRSRMRQQLFPTIEEIFGKKIEKNFARLGTLFQDLSLYFEEKSVQIQKSLTRGPFGTYLNLTSHFHVVELKYFFQRMTSISDAAVNTLLRLISKQEGSHLIQSRPYVFELSRFYLFMYRPPFPDFFQAPEQWIVKDQGEGDWNDFWQGKIKVPAGNYTMKRTSELNAKARKRLKNWYLAHGVPSFFYEKGPVFIKEGEIIGETLTGKSWPSLSQGKN